MQLIIIRGGGDLATGVIQRFFRSGFHILILECEKPTAIRRTVALSDAIYHKSATVEGMTAVFAPTDDAIDACFANGTIPIVIDPNGQCIAKRKPAAVIDAIIAKKNLGTNRSMAPITIALGPGFEAGVDVDVVIETMRGHDLGRLIFEGFALKNTGIPGEIGGKSAERVIHASESGMIKHVKKIGDQIHTHDVLFYINDTPIYSPIDGLLRGLIHEAVPIKRGMKIADVDPRINVDYMTISDKARSLGGSCLEAYLLLQYQQKLERK